ncbi:hypothetical protein WA158_006269 [Blastocystis sp. Blastoise]
MKNYYLILGVENTASFDDIKKAYRKLALVYHPDKSHDESLFSDIQEAWQTLSDTKKREQYDQTFFSNINDIGISDEIKLDEFSFDGENYVFNCRCGGTYEITQQDIDEGIELIECDNCSLIIKVIP